MTRLASSFAAGTALALITATSLAQTPGAEPAYGTIGFTAGAGEDPRSAGVRAGGAFGAHRLDEACSGFISEAPVLALDYEAGEDDLYISAASDADTTLVVIAPDASVHCNDDAGERYDPGVVVSDPASGRYQIWVGTFEPGIGLPPAMVHVSGTGFHDANPWSRRLDPERPAEHSERLAAGFRDDPRRFEVSAGGDLDIGAGGTGCYGYAGEGPDLALDYRAGRDPLYISGEGEFDGVLAVHTPGGEWVCDDDSAGDLDPGVVLADPASGRYAIWYGTYSETGERPGTIIVSEVGLDGVDRRLDPGAAARHGTIALESGFTPDPRTLDITAGGARDALPGQGEIRVAAGYCTGFVTAEPALELDYTAGGFSLMISASGEEDLTLAVRAPDGTWHCDDDGSQGVDPGVAIDAPQSGVYAIYAGTFSDTGAMVPAALHVSEIGFGPDGTIEPGAEEPWGEDFQTPLDITLPAIYGDHTLEAGFPPDPYAVELEAGGPLDAYDAIGGAEYCAGYVTEAPSVELAYSGAAELHVYVTSGGDTTLAVNTPDGSWVCDDDGGTGVDAGLSFPAGASGVYDIYVGTYGGEILPATLNISEIGRPQD